MNKRTPVQTMVLYAALVGGSLVMLIPLVWMILTSLKTFPETLAEPPSLLPAVPQWGNYRTALTEFRFSRFLGNTAFVTLMSVAGSLFSCTLAAYAFACLKFRHKNVLFALLMSGMMLPGQVTVIPLFMLYSRMGWIDSYLPLVVPPWLALNVFGIFLIRQFFLTIPRDYIEAARIDGASEWTILWRIYVPLSSPVLMTVTVFTFLGAWNDLWGPLIYLHDERLYTMSIGLLNFISVAGQAQGTPWHLVMAVSAIMVIPIIIVFFVSQKRFIEGIAATGVKG